MRPGLECGGRGDVEHAPEPARHHSRQHQPRQLRQRDDIDLQQREFLLCRVFVEFAVEAEAGVVDQHVDGQIGGTHCVVQLLCCTGAAQIAGEYVHGHLVALAQFVGQLLQPLFVACHQDQIVMVFRQQPGEFFAQAGRCAGNQRGQWNHGVAPVVSCCIVCGPRRGGLVVGWMFVPRCYCGRAAQAASTALRAASSRAWVTLVWVCA